MKMDLIKYVFTFIILLILVPIIKLFQPFHIAFIFIPGLFIFYKPSRNIFFIIITFLILFGISVVLTFLFKNDYFSFNIIYQTLFFFFILLFYDIGSKIDLDLRSFYKWILVISFILSFLILNQMIFHINLLSDFYLKQLSENNIKILDHYLLILYPFENSNSAAILFSFIILVIEIISLNKRVILSQKEKLLTIFVVLILLAGVILSYARTTLAALVLSQVFIFRKRILKLIPFILLFGLIILFIIKNDLDRNINYYSTIFNFTQDHSFTSRFIFWENIFNILKNNRLFVLTGVPFYKKELAIIQTGEIATVIDSNYLYILIKTGILGFIFLLFSALRLFFKNLYLQSIIFFIAIVSITLAFFDDYRFAILISFFIGLINNNLNTKELDSYEE